MPGRGERDPKIDDRSRSPVRTRVPVEGERRVAAWIGASIVIRGQVTSSEDMTIAGRVEGDVEVRENVVVITPEGHVEGNVVALAVIVNGRVVGDIDVQRRIEVGSTGSVVGDIVAPRMRVAEGAILSGRLRIAETREGGAREAGRSA